jgi:transcriptional regulator with XRE-family HTH domain
MPRNKLVEALAALTQEEVARAMGITTQRVGQLEKSALKKLRAAFEKRGFEQREPTKPFPHGVMMLLAQAEREEWSWERMLADCDLNESPVARDWRAQ